MINTNFYYGKCGCSSKKERKKKPLQQVIFLPHILHEASVLFFASYLFVTVIIVQKNDLGKLNVEENGLCNLRPYIICSKPFQAIYGKLHQNSNQCAQKFRI